MDGVLLAENNRSSRDSERVKYFDGIVTKLEGLKLM